MSIQIDPSPTTGQKFWLQNLVLAQGIRECSNCVRKMLRLFCAKSFCPKCNSEGIDKILL